MAFEFRSSLLAICLTSCTFFVSAFFPAAFFPPVWAETSATVDPADVQRSAIEDPMVCKRIVPTGSRIARRYCLKQSQWDAMREGGQRAARDAAIQESQFGYRAPSAGGSWPR